MAFQTVMTSLLVIVSLASISAFSFPPTENQGIIPEENYGPPPNIDYVPVQPIESGPPKEEGGEKPEVPPNGEAYGWELLSQLEHSGLIDNNVNEKISMLENHNALPPNNAGAEDEDQVEFDNDKSNDIYCPPQKRGMCGGGDEDTPLMKEDAPEIINDAEDVEDEKPDMFDEKINFYENFQ